MLAVGCIIPFVTVAIGAGLGSYLGDIHGGYIGAAAGLGAAIVIFAVGFLLLDKLRRN